MTVSRTITGRRRPVDPAAARVGKAFAALDSAALSEWARGDQQLLINKVRSTLLMLREIKPWQKDPDTYSAGISNAAYVLMERDFAPVDERLRLLIAREKQMPGALQAARSNLDDPPQIYTEIALQQLPGIIDFFRQDVPAAVAGAKDESLRRQFAHANAAVIRALEAYQGWLNSSLLPKSHGDFRIGVEAFRRKLAYDEMVDTPTDALLALDIDNMRANQREFARIAKELEPNKSARQVLAQMAADHPAPGRLMDALRGLLDQLVVFIQDRDIVTIPSPVRPILQETPPFMRATTFASMDTPGPFEPRAREAYFNVTLPEAGWSAQRTEGFLANVNYSALPALASHEAYPGHYVQFLWMFDVHDRVRKILGADSNSEGWAHYCEQMMLDENLAQALYPSDQRKQKLARLGQLQEALLRNARFVVGIRMHTGRMTIKEAEAFFVDEGYQSPEVAAVEAKRGTSDPTYLYYTLGKLEILKLRRDLAEKQGASFSLRQFHDDFLRQGAPPIAIVRRAMLHDDSPPL